jgi:putative ABC transport system permease protein
MALGAREQDVVRMVLGHGLRLVCVGLAVGAIGLFAGGRVLGSLLFGIGAADPTTLVAIALVLVLVALLASWLPARRAARTSPMGALRRD